MSLSSFDAPLFDAYLIVDWSAAKQPTTGPDSIWWALARRDDRSVAVAETANPPTRAEAARQLASTLAGEFAEGRRVLVGFDFPFGYAAGTAARLGGEEADWKTIWTVIDELLEDGEDNANNRFRVGAELNRRLTGEAFPFWGHDGAHEDPHLVRRARRPHGPNDLAERRLCEARLKGTQPAWKLAYTGSVGSQTLTGIPRVKQLLDDPEIGAFLSVWPFPDRPWHARRSAGGTGCWRRSGRRSSGPTRIWDRSRTSGRSRPSPGCSAGSTPPDALPSCSPAIRAWARSSARPWSARRPGSSP